MEGFKIDIAPMSVNRAWRGKRFKTPEYKKYENDVLFLLPKIIIPPPPFKIEYEFGMSSSLSDIDNPTKQFQDILTKKYGFNDKDILLLIVKKTKTEKSKEFVRFNITTLKEC